ncbi:hypothetical protein [Micromonospora sp. NPDC000442]|uniref:hypothetical protein n=1 Tax=Micromonospora sp. NPDC000442 TaxID=3364217 RepID=UPI00367A0585
MLRESAGAPTDLARMHDRYRGDTRQRTFDGGAPAARHDPPGRRTDWYGGTEVERSS